MSKKKHTAEEIVTKLREADVLLAKGQSIVEACRQIGVSDQTYYKWRKEYGGLGVDQAKRLKELEQENGRLRKVVADLVMEASIPTVRWPTSSAELTSTAAATPGFTWAIPGIAPNGR